MPLTKNSQKLMEPFFDTYDKISWKPNTIKSILTKIRSEYAIK